MDGTLIGNKHIVAISVNCVEGGRVSGVQSNFPCIFCTQHKSKLGQPDTTSYFDIQKDARTLEEQKLCLKKGEKNNKGYKCEPLFGDLFEFSDYIMDTLHMKLRVYDVFMTDILHHASKRERYGKEHDVQMEKKLLDGNAIADVKKLVNDFRELLDLLKIDPLKRGTNLKSACVQFLQTFNAACLRSNVTPYLHIVGNHLYEFDEKEDLGAFNMQGVEKGNDLLSANMQPCRPQHTLGFYRQLNNTGLTTTASPPLHALPVQEILPQPPRLSSVQPLIQRFIFHGALAKRGWQKNKSFFITQHQYKQLKLAGTNGHYKPSELLLNALNVDLQFHHEGKLHQATNIQFRIIKQKKENYETPTVQSRAIINIFVLSVRFIRAQPTHLV
ncbi:unnamed protein product [Didymodactylos carnosus]|uniref:Uncharacterized protein n=1 Tax=Didymodactylos carnosus TaxID=1234261 RepID=A0A815JUJ4_9BILA|nr:unnamed protein product [Didymodactylos carnosus]CAF4281681.1 unnamed protein product [Didymodactylos carnosus]